MRAQRRVLPRQRARLREHLAQAHRARRALGGNAARSGRAGGASAGPKRSTPRLSMAAGAGSACRRIDSARRMRSASHSA